MNVKECNPTMKKELTDVPINTRSNVNEKSKKAKPWGKSKKHKKEEIEIRLPSSR